MYKVQNKEQAEMFGLPVGYVLGKAEEARLRPLWEQHLREQDEARYQAAVSSAPNNAYVVTDTWQRNGKSLRRGEVVYVKAECDGLGAAMVTRSKSKTAQGFVWTCGMDEVRAYAAQAKMLRKDADTRSRAVKKVGRGETLTGEEQKALGEQGHATCRRWYDSFTEEQKHLCKEHMRNGFTFCSAVVAAKQGMGVRKW